MENKSYQVHFFGDFKDIEAQSETMITLMNLFKEFSLLPSTIHELNPVISPMPLPRPAFVSFTNDFNIEIGSERISIIKDIANSTDDTEDMKKFIQESIQILDKIISNFDKRGVRVSLVTQGLYPKVSDQQLEEVYLKFVSPLDYYNDNKPVEWNARSVSRIEKEILNRKEIINVITDIGRAQGRVNNNGIVTDFDRITLKVDINTIPELVEKRLNTESIEEFLNLAMERRKDLISQVELRING
ncbi:hypothetical protein [Bacillus cereus]